LEEDPRRRMTLTDALNHPWLQSYTPVYDYHYFASMSSIPTDDFSMISAAPEGPESFQSNSVNQDFENMKLQASTSAVPQAGVPGAFPDGIAENGMKSEGSRAPLQRRSDLMSQAAEDGKPITEPSWEMLAAVVSQDQPTAGPSNPPAKGQNKRVHSELTPLFEEGSLNSAIDGSSPLSEADSSSQKKGKSLDEDDPLINEASGSGRTTRGKGKAAAGAAAPSKPKSTRGSGEISEDEAVQPRRSGRLPPQKVARRA
jgi:serine/threonine/tyrosine protein kinase RAD53